jgi:hypothetical protein
MLVVGPGGYRFGDRRRLGLPLSLLAQQLRRYWTKACRDCAYDLTRGMYIVGIKPLIAAIVA